MDDNMNGRSSDGQAYGRVDNLENAFPEAPLRDPANAANPQYPQPASFDNGPYVSPDNSMYGNNPQANTGGYAPASNAGYPTGGYGPVNDPYGTAGDPYGTQNGGYGAPQPQNPYVREEQPKKGNAVSIVSLVFGILSILCCWTIVLPFIFSLVAIICGVVGAVKKQNKALWIIGIVCGVLGVVVTVLVLAAMLPAIREIVRQAELYGGDLSPEDIYDILEEYGIHININTWLPKLKF